MGEVLSSIGQKTTTYYLLFSQGLGANPDSIAPVPQLDVIMDKYRYNSQTKTLIVPSTSTLMNMEECLVW